MIEAYNYYDPLSEADVIVFAKGTIENPIISKIVKINLTQSIDIEAKRSELYATERKGLRRPFGEVFTYYSKSDFIGKRKYERNSVKSIGNNNGFNAKRRASEIKANPIVEFYINEDENTVTYRYANGEIITEKLDDISNKRYALTDTDIADGSIERLHRPTFKERVAESFKEGKQNVVPAIIATEIQLTNAQAGIEHVGKKLGMSNVEALVQRCRASRE